MITNIKVLIAAINLMKMTGPIKSELKVLLTFKHEGELHLVVKGNLDRQSTGEQSLFWKSRAHHAVVQFNAALSKDDEIALRLVRSYSNIIPTVGELVSLSGWLGEVPEHFGLSDQYQEIQIPNGTKAWLFPNESSRWIIHIHGRRARMGETLRNVSHLAKYGFNQLTISMESDPKPFGLGKTKSNLGDTEWLEIERAVLYARDHGAREIILFAWSQGALISGQFLIRSKNSGLVKGAIFDSPLLDYRSTMRFHAKRNRVPEHLGDKVIDSIASNKMIRVLGFNNVDVDRLSLTRNKLTNDVPVLVLFSEKDGHVEMSDVYEFNKVNKQVTLVEIQGAKHCRLYNHDQSKYLSSIDSWLRENQI
jgi:alpha-beta hydrolase superfamily lysophospholipase